MTITYNWRIADLDYKTADGYVFTAHWTVTATSSELDSGNKPYKADSYGSVGLERPSNLIPYEALTEEIVVGWVKAKLGAEEVSQIESSLAAEILEMKKPKEESGLPWVSHEEIEAGEVPA